MNVETEKRYKKIERIGIVVSDKMDRTISVEISRRIKHPVVGKYIRQRSKCMAHDEKNEAKIGDKVKIVEAHPLSKKKRWVLKEIVSKNISLT